MSSEPITVVDPGNYNLGYTVKSAVVSLFYKSRETLILNILKIMVMV